MTQLCQSKSSRGDSTPNYQKYNLKNTNTNKKKLRLRLELKIAIDQGPNRTLIIKMIKNLVNENVIWFYQLS